MACRAHRLFGKIWGWLFSTKFHNQWYNYIAEIVTQRFSNSALLGTSHQHWPQNAGHSNLSQDSFWHDYILVSTSETLRNVQERKNSLTASHGRIPCDMIPPVTLAHFRLTGNRDALDNIFLLQLTLAHSILECVSIKLTDSWVLLLFFFDPYHESCCWPEQRCHSQLWKMLESRSLQLVDINHAKRLSSLEIQIAVLWL